MTFFRANGLPPGHRSEGRAAPVLPRAHILRVTGTHSTTTVMRNLVRVNSETFKVNSERRRVVQRSLRYVAALAAGADTHEDAKQIAAETGIALSEIYELRAARRNPQLDVWYALLQRRPDLKPQVDRITASEATSEEIAKLIAFFQGSGR